jgi:hypothetical protein
MPVGEKQKLITEIVSSILGERPRSEKFHWFINQHQQGHFKESYHIIDKIHSDLGGNNSIKRRVQLQCDAYFGGKYNFLFEFDEFQHFSTARLTALNNYPKDLKLNYSVDEWKKLCLAHAVRANKYRSNKVTIDFNFVGGRTHQRAYLDCFRDLLPQHNNLNPTLRISEFEVIGINQINAETIGRITRLIEGKIKYNGDA